MSEFLKKERERLDRLNLGRVENTCTETSGKEHVTQERRDAKKSPPLVTVEAFPVGRSLGVCKPGEESK